MNRPHRRLLWAVRVCHLFALTTLLLAAADALYLTTQLEPGRRWDGFWAVGYFCRGTTPAEHIRNARVYAENALGHLLTPAVGLAAAHLLRLAAAGRLRAAPGGGPLRLPAVVGLWAAGLWAAFVVGAWVHSPYPAAGPWLGERLAAVWAPTGPPEVPITPTRHSGLNYSQVTVAIPADGYPVRRAVAVLRDEFVWLSAGLATPGVLFCLCGTVCCLTRPDPPADP